MRVYSSVKAALLGTFILGNGCNMVKLTADQTANVLQVAAPSLNMESDVQLAREAAPGQLKTIEGFLLASPDNPKIIAILAQGYCEYAFGFLESDAEELVMARKDEEATLVIGRATGLYLRCMNYGLKLLGPSWEKAIYGDLEGFEKKVAASGRSHLRGMFWTAMGLASAINMNRDDIEMVSHLPKARMLFERVVALDEKFYNGGAHMALGMLLTAQGAALGGKPEDGKKHFERAIELTGGKFLMPKVLLAMNYGTIVQDRKFFHDTLTEVLGTSPAIWPEQRLANEIAHVRAKRYLAHETEWF
ncbi:MAG: hypothetical protein HY698_16545 [Deltaproteobacteria bacterium]|nr:hypothetical protein [Deltaproteobacteria bacterium]